MHDEDLRLERKRSRRFSCSMIGAGVAFLALTVAIVFCSNQLAAVSTFILEAAPGETAESGVDTLYSVAYAARIGNHAASTERIRFNLEDTGPIELICEDNQIYGRVMEVALQEEYSTWSYFRLVNRCESTVTFKFCWFYDSIFALQPFPPACAV